MLENRGFCKFMEECEFRHSEIICEKYLQDGKCQRKECPDRHPKDCQYWVKCEIGCKREDTCMYLHCNDKKFKLENERMETEEIVEYSCDECNVKCENKANYKNHVKSHHKDLWTKGANDNLEKNEKIEALQKEIISKEETIKELVIRINKSEDTFVEQTKKLKRYTNCARNAGEEVKRLTLVKGK